MRQTGVESIAETSAEREIRRDETQRGNAGRDESRAPAETKAERRQRRNACRKRDAKREKPRAMTAQSSSSCSASYAAHSSSSREQLHKARACNNTAYSNIIDCLTGDILLAVLFTGDIIDWHILLGDILLAIFLP